MNDKLTKYKPAGEGFEFRNFPFYWVIRLGNRYTQLMEKQLKQDGINITSWRVALILHENGKISMTDIATHAVGRLPTITKTVYRMEEQGLVRVSTNQNDGRVTMVEITEQGKELVKKLIIRTDEIISRAYKGMKESEINRLNSLLKIVFENL